MKRQVILLLAIIAFFASCTKIKNEDPAVNGTATGVLNEPGVGTSKMPFTAAAWQLPAGVELQDSIHDYSYCWAFPPNTQVLPKDWKGVPLGFSFCLTLKNTSTHTIIINFPPQLIYSSASLLHQNILTIDLGSVELIAGEAKTIVTEGFCINLGRKIPQTFDEGTGDFLRYAFGPATIPSALQEVVDIIRSKHISMNDIVKADGNIDNNKAAKYAVIQTAIWEVTDKQGLTGTTKNQLLSL
jgi:hypothetical protein